MEECDAVPIGTFPGAHPEAQFFLNPAGEFTALNEAFAQLAGYPAAHLLGRALAGLLDPADAAGVRPVLEHALRGEVLTFGVHLLDPAGRRQELVLTTFPLRDQGTLTGVGGLARTAEAVRQSAQAVREREAQLSIIFRTVADVIFVLRVEPGGEFRFLFVNQAYEDNTGRALAEVVGRLVQEVVPESSQRASLARYREAARTRQRLAWTETIDYPSGRRVGEVSVTPVLDEAGECCQLVGTVHDLTAQQRVEQDLRASNERFTYALKATTDALYDWDVAADTLHWGEGFEDLFGYQLASNRSTFRQWSDFVHPDDAARTVDDLAFTATQTQRHHWQQEYRFQRADGTWAVVFDRGYLIRDETGRALRMIGAMQDITERTVAAEKQRQMAQELSRQNAGLLQFSYIVSHNLRAPLANARGYADLLGRVAPGSAVFEESLQHLRTSLQELDAVITDVTSVLTVRDQGEVLRPESVGLAAVCEQVRYTLAPALRACGGTIDCDLPPDLLLTGSRAYVHSIFYNLLANAVKYRAADRPLQVMVAGGRRPGQGLVLTVVDNGSGFDAEQAGGRVFQLYSRFHAVPEGRGMGLFLVKSQVEALGGRVEVRSRVGEGTCFTLYFD